MRSVERDAHAKINLFLRVGAQRADGYHEVETLVAPISLADGIRVTPADGLTVEVVGPAARAGDVPIGGLNLAIVAALALGDACAGRGASIRIEKRIPAAAGLGGGSADAAATLHALNELWGCGLDVAALAAIGEAVGSDVPALVLGGPTLATGRGERLAPAAVARTWWVLLHHEDGVRSPDAYRWFDEDGGVAGPGGGQERRGIGAGDAAVLAPLLYNDLEAPVVRRHPAIGAGRDRLVQAGALAALMSGSGSSVVGLCRDEGHARQVADAVPGASVVSTR
ncbi:MAG: 4-(cytidine 5'-diphospho)-2-C-methyl-D-erythritol kinase [Actinomycetota bacterium]